MHERIRLIRERNGLSQQAFADRIASTATSICRYESGERKPSNTVLLAICKEFKVNRAWLVNGEGEMLLPPVESPTPGLLAANYSDLPERIMKIVDVLAQMDPSWYNRLEELIKDMDAKRKDGGAK